MKRFLLGRPVTRSWFTTYARRFRCSIASRRVRSSSVTRSTNSRWSMGETMNSSTMSHNARTRCLRSERETLSATGRKVGSALYFASRRGVHHSLSPARSVIARSKESGASESPVGTLALQMLLSCFRTSERLVPGRMRTSTRPVASASPAPSPATSSSAPSSSRPGGFTVEPRHLTSGRPRPAVTRPWPTPAARAGRPSRRAPGGRSALRRSLVRSGWQREELTAQHAMQGLFGLADRDAIRADLEREQPAVERRQALLQDPEDLLQPTVDLHVPHDEDVVRQVADTALGDAELSGHGLDLVDEYHRHARPGQGLRQRVDRSLVALAEGQLVARDAVEDHHVQPPLRGHGLHVASELVDEEAHGLH